VLRIAQAFVQRQITTPKTKAGVRIVNLPAKIVALLRQHEQQMPAKAAKDGTSYVIRQENGQPIDSDNWGRRVWPTIRVAAKLPETISLHNLRHSFGSLLLAGGAPIKHVSQQLGHANVSITMNIYAHVLRETSATSTRQLDRHIPVVVAERRPFRLVKKGAA
jgi:integrase